MPLYDIHSEDNDQSLNKYGAVHYYDKAQTATFGQIKAEL